MRTCGRGSDPCAPPQPRVAIRLDCGPGSGARQIFIARHPDRAQLGQLLCESRPPLNIPCTCLTRFSSSAISACSSSPYSPSPGTWPSNRDDAEFGDAIDEIAQHIGQILVHDAGKMLPGEVRIGAFRRIRHEIIAPIVGRQNFQRGIHEHAALLRSGELAAVVVDAS